MRAPQVKGKLNAITLDQCAKTGLVFDSVVASCEVVNSTSVQVRLRVRRLRVCGCTERRDLNC